MDRMKNQESYGDDRMRMIIPYAHMHAVCELPSDHVVPDMKCLGSTRLICCWNCFAVFGSRAGIIITCDIIQECYSGH